MQLVREVVTPSARRAVRNFMLWRLGVWAFVALVAFAGLAQQDGSSASGPPAGDDASGLTDEERALRVCLPPPVTTHAVRAVPRHRAPGPSMPLGRSVATECPSCHKDSGPPVP